MQYSSTQNIAIFASGEGSNAQLLFDYFKNIADVNVSILVCNRKDAGVFARAKNANVKSLYLPKKEFYESNTLIESLDANAVDFIVLSGFLLKIPTEIVQKYQNRIINIHPSLLPKHGGAGMYGMHVHSAVKEAQDKESGISIHLVNEVYDDGEIIFQASCDIFPTDDTDTIKNKVQKLEHEHFAPAVHRYIQAYGV